MQTGECRFDMTNVKCGVDTHRPGGTQTDRDRINNFGYWKWTDKPGGELARLHSECQIFGRQPNLFGSVIRSRRPLPVCHNLISSGLPQEVLARELPGPLAAANKRQIRWDRKIGICGMKERERVTMDYMKREKPDDAEGKKL